MCSCHVTPHLDEQDSICAEQACPEDGQQVLQAQVTKDGALQQRRMLHHAPHLLRVRYRGGCCRHAHDGEHDHPQERQGSLLTQITAVVLCAEDLRVSNHVRKSNTCYATVMQAYHPGHGGPVSKPQAIAEQALARDRHQHTKLLCPAQIWRLLSARTRQLCSPLAAQPRQPKLAILVQHAAHLHAEEQGAEQIPGITDAGRRAPLLQERHAAQSNQRRQPRDARDALAGQTGQQWHHYDLRASSTASETVHSL